MEVTDTSDHSTKKTHRLSKLAILLIGLVFGALIILGIRFATYSPHDTHYHANFAVYINGQRENFKDPQYYEEVKLCSLHGTTPQSRTHMHDEENGVIHVHDDAVTWGAFFENLGWMVGSNFVQAKDKLYTADDANKVNIMLNGQDLTDLTDITDEVIRDKDRLLVSFGPSDQAELRKEFSQVPASAATYDAKPDPASCAGPESITVKDRLKNLF